MIVHRQYSCGCVKPVKVNGLTYRDSQIPAKFPCPDCRKGNVTDVLKDLFGDLFKPVQGKEKNSE